MRRLSTSASERNKKDKKGLAFFETSDTGYISEYGLFNSTGQLLKGNELFEQYSELAKQLDTKRSAFYLQLKENEIIFGCSLIVKAANGREERVVFIQVNKNLSSGYKIKFSIELLKRFYEVVQDDIETFELKKYQLVGLWNEGDFRNIEDVEIERGIKYTLGKISAGKKVSIKISELSSGLTLILELIAKSMKNLPLIFDVSQYPSEYNVSISLIKPNPDFEIGEKGNILNLANSESWILYEKLGEKLFEKRSYSKGGQNQSDYISSIVQMILNEPEKYWYPSNPLFNDYDDGEKVEIFMGLIQNINKKNYYDISRVLINIYGKIAGSKSKKNIHIILFSKNIYIKELIKDLIKEIHEKHNKDFFNVLFNDDTSPDNFSINFYGSKYSFEQGVKDVLEDLKYSQQINFVRFIAREARSEPEKKGAYLLKSLVSDILVSRDYKDFISEISEEDLGKLDEILGSDHLSRKKELKKKNRSWIRDTFIYTGVLVAIILMGFASYNFLMGGGGDKTPIDNTKNISNLNETYPGKGEVNSSSDNVKNTSVLNKNDLNGRDANSSSDNVKNTSVLNKTDLNGRGTNLSSNNQKNNSTPN